MEDLDSQEKLHLAMHAIDNKQHDIAIQYLKQITEGSEYPRAQYLLAAEYAQIGLYERAKSGLAQVIEISPTLTLAALQKGLLHITLGELDEGRETLQGLSDLDKSDPLHWFGGALLALIEGNADACTEQLQKGMELNKVNAALNKDMNKILKKLQQSDLSSTEEEVTQGLDATTDATKRFLLSNYDGS